MINSLPKSLIDSATKMITETADTLVVHRSQIGDGMRSCHGEAGPGIYAHLPNPAMRKYYTSNGEDTYKLSLHKPSVIDLTHPTNMKELLDHSKMYIDGVAKSMPGYVKPKPTSKTIQRYGDIIRHFVSTHHSWAKAYIVPHVGPGIPTGKQVVIMDDSIIKDQQKV